MSTLAKEELTQTQFITALIYSLFLTLVFSTPMLIFTSLITLWLLKRFFIKRYGGFTGDIYGFSIEVTELVLLNIILLGFGL